MNNKNILNELAVISDHLEKISLESKNKTIVIDLNKEEFDKMYELIINKNKSIEKKETNQLNINIGQVNFKFNMYNA